MKFGLPNSFAQHIIIILKVKRDYMPFSHGYKNLIFALIMVIILAGALPPVSAEYTIEISSTNVTPNQEVTVTLEAIPQDKLINMSLNSTIQTTIGEEMDYHIWNFTFPYESGISTFQVDMYNLEPGTPATVSVIREDGTEASNTGNVSDEGRYNASIFHDLNRGMYNVSFIGIPASEEVRADIDFGGITRVLANPTDAVATTDSTFTPSGFSHGAVDLKVYVDHELQKSETIIVSTGVE
ncbi:MAG: hypothetical protein CVV33_05975 [Methanomicrobiales archaeon HGW-Methanomicrobiales-4]|nr:MAG: hypothetical protein CVV33_05975 [Methanomicrobiales archaeon HGW-Methanomicrobiales-4]